MDWAIATRTPFHVPDLVRSLLDQESSSLLCYWRKPRNPSLAHQLICCLGPDETWSLLSIESFSKALNLMPGLIVSCLMLVAWTADLPLSMLITEDIDNETWRYRGKDCPERTCRKPKDIPMEKTIKLLLWPATGVAVPQLSNPSSSIQEPCILWRKISSWMLSLVIY